jgi:hemerythrin-like domain-containing protein
MATETDSPSTQEDAQAPARARKASKSGADNAAKPAAKRGRKPASAKTSPSIAETVTGGVGTARKGMTKAAGNAAGSIKAAASDALDATHVPDAAKSVAAKVRAVRKAPPARKPEARKGAATRKRASGMGAGAVIGAAAAGIAAGLVANLGRKAAVQAPSMMAGDWFEALKAEHTMALTLLDKLAQSKPEQPARRTMLLTQLKHALGKHAFTEENVIYPALRDWGDKADADALNHEHGYVKQYLYDLENMEKSAPEFATKISDFRADLEKHIRDEEDKIFPKIHAGLSDEKNKLLTAQANKEGFKLA